MALEGRQHFGMAMEAAEGVLGIRFVLEQALAVKRDFPLVGSGMD